MNKANIGTIVVILTVYTTSRNTVLVTSAHLKIAGLFEIYSNEEGQCKDVIPSSVQILEAAKWSLRQLNKNNYVPGITIGLEAFPTCGLASKASKTLIEILTCNNEQYSESCQQKDSHVFGVIGPSYSKEVKATATILNSLPPEDKIPQIGFSATASEFRNKTKYPNFLSVIASDRIQVNVMVELMKNLRWTYVAVLYENDIYGIQGATQLSLLAKENDICIANKTAIDVDQNEEVSANSVRRILESLLVKQVKGAVFFGSSPLANTVLRVAKQMPFKEKITFIFSEAMELKESTFKANGEVIKESIGSYVVSPPVIFVDEFSGYWTNLFKNVSEIIQESKTNSYLLDVFEMYGGCRPTENNECSPIDPSIIAQHKQSLYVGYAITATLAFGILMRNAYWEVCGVSNYDNCTWFTDNLINNKEILISKQRQLSNLSKNTPFASLLEEPIRSLYTNSNDPSLSLTSASYDVYEFGDFWEDKPNFCLTKKGGYKNGVLKMDAVNSTQTVLADCPAGVVCLECIEKDYYEKIYFQEGHFYVIGVVPVCHKNKVDPMGCDKIKTSHSIEIAEVMAFAVKQLNEHTQFFGNKKIGFIILNSCNQRLVIQRKILDLLETGVRFPNNSVISVRDKILGFVGGFSSTVTIAISDIISRLHFVQVGYASTATCLSDRVSHKNFLRVVPSVTNEAKTIIRVLKELKGSNYIQIIYSEGAFGESFKNEFKKEAKSKNICIANEFKVREDQYSSIIDTLRKNSYAKIVLAFLQSYMAEGLSAEIKNNMLTGEFLFIGTVAWGNDKQIIDGNRKLSGSLKLSLEMKDVYGFNDYIREINIKAYKQNPWYKEYIQNKYNCYIEGSFNKTSNKKCRKKELPERSLHYKQEQWTPYAYSAMVAFLKGANNTFHKLCGGGSDVLCEEYQQRPDVLADDIKHVQLDVFGQGKPGRIFDDNGDGSVAYKIYNIKRSKDDPQNVDYFKIGESRADNGNIEVHVNKISLPQGFELPSTCPNSLRCQKCFGGQNKTTESEELFKLRAAAIGMTILAVIIIILVSVILVRCCIEKHSNRRDNSEKKNIQGKQRIATVHDHYDLIFNDQTDASIIDEEVFQYNDRAVDSYLTTNFNGTPHTEINNNGNERKQYPIKITFTNMGTV